MEEEEVKEKPNISKLSRKVGEKIRRDKLNGLLIQLAEEIPTIKCAQRRPDKLAILRLTVSYLKLNQGLKKRKIVSQCLRTHGFLYDAARRVTDGVMFVMTKSGSILYVSENIQTILGFHQIDVMGFNIEKFIHTADIATFRSQFSKQSFMLASFEDDLNKNGINSVEVHSKDKTSFCLRMLHASKKRHDDDSPIKEYEMMHFSSFLDHGNQEIVQEPWIVAFMKPVGQESINEIDVKVSEFTKSNEYASLHSLDGIILATEHRASLFHGYMNYEVVGKSPYVFIIDEDLESIALSHRLILKEDEIPVTTFRMKSRYDSDIYIQSRSVIVCDKWTKQPKCIVSVNTIYPEKEGKILLREQKQKQQKLLQLGSFVKNYKKASHKSSQSVTNSPAVSESTHEDDLARKRDMLSFSLDDSHSRLCNDDFDVSSSAHSLCQIYEQQAKTFPELYSRHYCVDESGSNSYSSVKRSFEENEASSESGSGSTGYVSGITDISPDDTSQSRDENGSERDKAQTKKDSIIVDIKQENVNFIGVIQEKRNSSNTDNQQEKRSSLENNFQEATSDEIGFDVDLKHKRNSICADHKQEDGSSIIDISGLDVNFEQEKSSASLDYLEGVSQPDLKGSGNSRPILKGILEGQLTISDIVHKGGSPTLSSNSELDSSNRLSDCSPVADSGVGVEDSSSHSSSLNSEHRALGVSPDQLHLSESDDRQMGFKSKFSLQLHGKHVKLRETLLSQKSALQYIQSELILRPETSSLSERELTVHKGLLEKIMEAENQIVEQSRTLEEIEQELWVHDKTVT